MPVFVVDKQAAAVRVHVLHGPFRKTADAGHMLADARNKGVVPKVVDKWQGGVHRCDCVFTAILVEVAVVCHQIRSFQMRSLLLL
jgi:hypothetical protein